MLLVICAWHLEIRPFAVSQSIASGGRESSLAFPSIVSISVVISILCCYILSLPLVAHGVFRALHLSQHRFYIVLLYIEFAHGAAPVLCGRMALSMRCHVCPLVPCRPLRGRLMCASVI